jgi:hypothetical protein
MKNCDLNLLGARQKWHVTQAPLSRFLHALQVSSYFAGEMEGIPSDGSKALALPNFTSGVQTAQVTWTQLLLTVLFKGSRGFTGRPISSCFFL